MIREWSGVRGVLTLLMRLRAIAVSGYQGTEDRPMQIGGRQHLTATRCQPCSDHASQGSHMALRSLCGRALVRQCMRWTRAASRPVVEGTIADRRTTEAGTQTALMRLYDGSGAAESIARLPLPACRRAVVARELMGAGCRHRSLAPRPAHGAIQRQASKAGQ